MNITIDTKSNGKYPLDNVKAFGYFNVDGTFIDWNPTKPIPSTIIVNLKDIIIGKYFNVSLCEYCKKTKKFEIHIEEVFDPRDADPSFNYIKAKNEDLEFKTGDKINVILLLYNSDPDEPEQEYYRCGKLDGQLKFPISKNKEGFVSDTDLDDGFDPKTKKGNILIGN